MWIILSFIPGLFFTIFPRSGGGNPTPTSKDIKPAVTTRRCLIFFAKMPLAGNAKTRLHSVMEPEEAAELYRCMLHDTLCKARRLISFVSAIVCYEPQPGAEEYFAAASQGMGSVPQVGDGLGERMEHAFRQQFGEGSDAVIIIGTDIPHLPESYIRDAFQVLDSPETDVVFGPAADGGYYLVGMKRLHRELFAGIRWSTDTVLEMSREIASSSGLRVSLLPLLHDVDTPQDLLRPELVDEANEAPLTRRFLSEFLPRLAGREASCDSRSDVTSALRSHTRPRPDNR